MPPVFSNSNSKSLVGLDIEAGSIAATEVSTNGTTRVVGHGLAPLAPGVFREGEILDVDALAEALKELFGAHKLSKTVRLGIANQKVAVRTLFLPPIEDPKELETAIRFQAQDQIPMPLDQAILDWAVIRHSATESGEHRMEVVVVAARRDMLAPATEAINKAGLRPVGIDLSAFAMIRALASGDHPGVGAAGFVAAPSPLLDPSSEQRYGAAEGMPAQTAEPAQLYCNLGDVVNLAVAQGRTCLFTRISPFGIEGIAQWLAERRGLTLEHARQWLTHVGLERSIDELEGDREMLIAAREALDDGSAKLAGELRRTLQYYGTQADASAVEGVVASGPGTSIPGLTEALQRDLGHPFSVGRPVALGHLDDAAAARLTLSFGLALEE